MAWIFSAPDLVSLLSFLSRLAPLSDAGSLPPCLTLSASGSLSSPVYLSPLPRGPHGLYPPISVLAEFQGPPHHPSPSSQPSVAPSHLEQTQVLRPHMSPPLPLGSHPTPAPSPGLSVPPHSSSTPSEDAPQGLCLCPVLLGAQSPLLESLGETHKQSRTLHQHSVPPPTVLSDTGHSLTLYSMSSFEYCLSFQQHQLREVPSTVPNT